MAHLPALADERSVDVDPCSGEVLAEDAVGERPAQLGLPVVEILARIGVHRLVRPPMRCGIADRVTGGTAPPGAWARVVERDRLWRWPLVDAGDAGVGMTACRRAADVDGKERRHHQARIAATSRGNRRFAPLRPSDVCSERCVFCSKRNR